MTNPTIDRATIRELIGREPNKITRYQRALTHSSFASDPKNKTPVDDYERLEYLGDRVLGLIIAEELYQQFPRESEGQLTQRFHILVSSEICAHIAEAIGLTQLVRLGEQQSQVNEKIAGDIMESLIAAIYLDLDLDTARRFVLRHWQAQIDSQTSAPQHPKAALQEWAAVQQQHPIYQLLSEGGSDPARAFHYAVRVGNDSKLRAEGKGKTIKAAQTEAAKNLLEKIAESKATNKPAPKPAPKVAKKPAPKPAQQTTKKPAEKKTAAPKAAPKPAQQAAKKPTQQKATKQKAAPAPKPKATPKPTAQQTTEKVVATKAATQTAKVLHPKILLNQWAAKQSLPTAKYKLKAKANSQQTTLSRVAVQIGKDKDLCAEGTGKNRKEAEVEAARELLAKVTAKEAAAKPVPVKLFGKVKPFS